MVNMDVEVLMDNESQQLEATAEIVKNKISPKINTDKVTAAVEDKIISKSTIYNRQDG
jgi:hypothetical protein